MLQSLGSDLRTLDSSDPTAPEAINRNAWQEGEKGQAFLFFSLLQNALKHKGENAHSFRAWHEQRAVIWTGFRAEEFCCSGCC